ncbi:MAG: glycosyltransferase [Ilumatobacteraceae bacterium]
MRVLGACSLGGAGHLRPLVPLLDAARRLGHEVGVVAPPAMAAMVAEAGFEWLGGAEPDEAEVRPIREALPVLPPDEASVLGERELFGRLAAGSMLPAMRAICDEWRPEAILRDPCERASTVVAAERGLPVAQVAISIAAGEWRAIGLSAPSVASFAAGAPALNRAMPFLTRFPASFDPSPFPATVRYHVPLVSPAETLPDWWDGSSAPLVYVTFGTVLGFMSHAADVYRVALAAVAGLDARVLLTVGWRFDASVLGTLPANVHVEPWVEHDAAVAAADVVVSHGGSGTVYGTLAAGVPMVNVPVFADQFANARLVAEAGAGKVVERPPAADGSRDAVGMGEVPEIASAVREVFGDERFADCARAVAAEMSATPTVLDAVTAVLAR